MSKAQQVLSDNLDSLIGDGRDFRSDADMGKQTGLGQRQIHRLRNQLTDARLSNLDVLSERLHRPVPALLSPKFDVIQGALPASISDIVGRIIGLANKDALTETDLAALSAVIQVMENTKAPVKFTSESQKRGTGT